MTRRAEVCAVLLSVALALTACSPRPTLPTSALTPLESQAPVPGVAELVAQRKAAGLPDCPASSELPAVAGGLPDVTLRCLGGDTEVRLGGLRGPLIVNFWAQWCAPCRLESPHLREFHQLSAGKVQVLGIDANDPRPELAIEFASLVGWTYVHLQDPDRSSMTPLGYGSIPISLFIDGEGKIVYRQIGAFGSTQQMRDLTARYLGVTV